MKHNRIFVIFVSYYTTYLNKSIYEIERLFYKKSNIIIVNNSKSIINSKHIVISGSNISGEFSGWDEGYTYLRNNFDLKDNDLVYLINDTFNSHHVYTFIDRYLIRRSAKKISHDENSIFGELNTLKIDLIIDDTTVRSWISSYFISGSNKSIKKLFPLNKRKLKNYTGNYISNNKIVVPFFCENLNNHLTQWLLSTTKKGWYGKLSRRNSIEFKLDAIINEKLLTSFIIKNDISIQNIYSGPFSYYNKIRNKIYSLLK